MAHRTGSQSHTLVRSLLVAAFLSAAFLVPARAEAKGLLLITYGDSIKDISALPVDAQKQLSDPELHFGYKYSYFGLFWLDIWTWGGEFCLFKGNNYESISVEDAAKLLGKPEKEITKPFFYKFPPLLMLLVLGIAAVVLLGVFGKKDETTGTGSGAAPPPNPGDDSEPAAT